jgi:hypothetical protein
VCKILCSKACNNIFFSVCEGADIIFFYFFSVLRCRVYCTVWPFMEYINTVQSVLKFQYNFNDSVYCVLCCRVYCTVWSFMEYINTVQSVLKFQYNFNDS